MTHETILFYWWKGFLWRLVFNKKYSASQEKVFRTWTSYEILSITTLNYLTGCRPYLYGTYVTHVSHVTPRFIWGHENMTPSSTAYYHGGFFFKYVCAWNGYAPWTTHNFVWKWKMLGVLVRWGVQNNNVRLTVHSIFQFKKYQQIIFFFKYKGLKKVRILSGLRTEKQR